MREYKVGEEITLVVKEASVVYPFHCKGCFFHELLDDCFGLNCSSVYRSDGKNVIFVEKGK